MSKFNKRKVWISSLIALSLLVNVLSASAEGINSTVSEISNVSESETQQKSESPIVSEDITKRGENEKHFLCEDGSYIAVAYADAVHEKNAQNEWIEIDNTLVSENNRIENNSESFHTSFSETANPVAVLSANAGELLSNNVADNSESQLVSIESGEHRLSWSLSAASMLNTQQAGQLQQQGCVLENTSNDSPVLYQSEQFIGALPAKHLYQHSLSSLSEAEIKNNINSQQEETNYQKTIATKAVSSVLYQNAFGDKVDLQYTVAPSKIKEDVILRESSAFRSYTMNVDTNGLTAVKSENNTVEFLKTDGTSVFTIQTPYMYDSADECSYDIDIIIEQTGNIASVTYTPDSNWINSGERVYPITIDPSVQAVSSLNRSSISDTYVHEGNGSCCSGINPSTHDRLYIGRKGNRIHRAYFKINTLPTIVSGSYINQAEVYAQCYNGTTTSKPFSINKVTSSWNDSTLGWSPQPASTDIQGGVERNTNYNVIQFNNCRAAIASLYNGNMANNGFMIHYTSETDNDYNSIYSYENANTSGCPYMVIYYTSPAGIATGTYYIRNKHSGHYLDAENKGGSGTNVLQYAFNGSTNQQWKIERQSNGLYVLKAVYNTGLALDVNNASESNSANIQVYNFNNSSAQQWYIIENNDGGYRILSRCSNGQKCVTVQNASTASGANVFQYDYTDNAGENDEWYLEKAETSKFSCSLSSTPIHSDRAKAWATSEADYNRWPATSKSTFYNQSEIKRRTDLAVIKTTAQMQTAAAQWTVFPNGGQLLQHYLNGSGTEMGIVFKKVNNGWAYAKTQRKKWVNEALAAAEEMAVLNKTITFWSKQEDQNKVPQGEINDYVLAINSFYSHIKCQVTKTGNSTYQATIYYYIDDIYDWDTLEEEKVGLISQRDLWELHHGGSAKAFKLYGVNKLTISWSQGQRYDTGATITDVE